jgi:hypothetical protein
VLDPRSIAGLNRALRKGREDNGDSPGAADFYYGEMEMRRRDQHASLAERLLIWSYWLVAGYGLRALRATGSLALAIVIFAFLFCRIGFDPRLGFERSLLFSAESTSSLFRVTSTPEGVTLTTAGQVLQIALRLLGPLFFGLAILSMRGRLKR